MVSANRGPYTASQQALSFCPTGIDKGPGSQSDSVVIKVLASWLEVTSGILRASDPWLTLSLGCCWHMGLGEVRTFEKLWICPQVGVMH